MFDLLPMVNFKEVRKLTKNVSWFPVVQFIVFIVRYYAICQ